ncbi:MAG: Hpt domain-containing protein [Bariatricus sp.]
MNRYKLYKAGVDINQGLSRLNNNVEFYESMMKKFRDDIHFGMLRNAMEAGDVQQAFQEAHALKGITGTLSFVRLYDSIVPLVEDLRSGDMEAAKKRFPEVEEAYEVLIEAL